MMWAKKTTVFHNPQYSTENNDEVLVKIYDWEVSVLVKIYDWEVFIFLTYSRSCGKIFLNNYFKHLQKKAMLCKQPGLATIQARNEGSIFKANITTTYENKVMIGMKS